MLQDLRFAVRLLLRRPGFTSVAILTLALGIGANTAIFSVVHAVVFQPLPFPEPQQLVRIYTQFPNQKFDKFWVSPPEFFELQRGAGSYSVIGGWRSGPASLVGGSEPVRVQATQTTAALLSMLGATPIVGQLYGDAEAAVGGPRVALLSEGLWRRAFAANPQIVGSTARLNGQPTTIVGILPRAFAFPGPEIEAWAPFQLDPNAQNRGSHFLNMISRLKPGVDIGQARAELQSVMAESVQRQGTQHPLHPKNHPVILEPLQQEVVGAARTPMLMLLAAVGFVLFIACANVANLFLARAEGRHREAAVRTAMGAGRGRLVRQFLTEAILVSVLGGIVGLAIGWGGLRAILSLDLADIPRAHEITIDLQVLAFTLLLSFATGALFGIAPALRVSAANMHDALKASSGRATEGREGRGYRRTLVVAETALAVMLVFGAGLMLRSFWRLLQVDPGFDNRNMITMGLALPNATYEKPEDVLGLFDRLRDRVAALPGVASVSLMSGLPPSRDINANDLMFEGMTPKPEGPIFNVDYWQIVADDYFSTMKIPLLAGRFIEASDGAGAPPVALVNKAMADKFWPGESPVGRRVKPGFPQNQRPWVTVVGVVGDVKQQGLDQPIGTELYMPMRQMPQINGQPFRTMNIVARSAGQDPLSLVAPIRSVIAELDPTLPIADVRTMEDVFGRAVARPRFLMLLLGVFAAVALTLAAIGIYGVLSYTVAQRTNEIGVRMALGANRADVMRLVVGQGMLLALAGVGVGLVGALAAGNLIRSMLFGVAPSDPLTLAGVAVVLVAVAFLACAAPARRATRVDPIRALRYE